MIALNKSPEDSIARTSSAEPSIVGGMQILLNRPDIWRGTHRESSLEHARPTLPSGYALLDQFLPNGGLPLGAICELLLPEFASLELSFVLPILLREANTHAQKTQHSTQRKIALIAPPLHLNAVALSKLGLDLSALLIVSPKNTATHSQDALWAAEQLLRSGALALLMMWSLQLSEQQLKRLQLAAEAGGCAVLLCRMQQCRSNPSPAALRLLLSTATPTTQARGALQVDILKCRGRNPSQRCIVLR